MKRLLAGLAVVGLGVLATATAQEGKPPADEQAAPQQGEGGEAKPASAPKGLESVEKRASYAIGYRIGTNFKQQGAEFDLDVMLDGIRDAMKGGDPDLTEQVMDEAMMAYEKELSGKLQARMETEKKANLEEATAFLAENKKKEGVTTLPSGLQYQVLREGTGPKPSATDVVRVHYEGTLIDGTVFDSSYKRGMPATFPVGRVIPGWVEALQLMNAGAKWRLWIPPDLAYGESPRPGGPIGPNDMLIFDVELISIEGKE